jgi:alpha-methylacyl-CoA racemase
MAAMTERPGPLAGIRVLDLSRMYPGAHCTSLLADLGADVVKLEAPGAGDGLRAMSPTPFKAGHEALNKGKRSVSLDLRNPGAADVLRRLVVGADVLVESNKPGQLEAQGLGYDDLSAINSGLVWCSLTGFGGDGPLATAPGHDLTYLGYSGLLGLLVEAGHEPPVPQSPVSLQLGALLGAVGILAALTERSRTGIGARVDAPLAGAATWAIAENVAQAAHTPIPGWGSLAARAVYRCADGRHVTVTASEPKPWALLVAALELPELAGYRMGIDEAATRAALAERFATKPAAAWLANPGYAGGVGAVNTPADLLDDPHAAARGDLVAVGGTGTRVLANPLRLRTPDGPVPTTATTPAPELGAHTDEVLAAAGFSPEELAALRSAKVI